MTKPANVTLPKSLESAARRLAKEDGVSLSHWVSLAVAQKIGAVESAAEFLKRRAKGANGQGLLKHLDQAPDVPPQPGDEPPSNFRRAGFRPRRRR